MKEEINIQYITSMNQEYFDRTGKLMIKSFTTNFKKQLLNVYNEDYFIPKLPEQSGPHALIHLRGWALGANYKKFQSRHRGGNKRILQFSKKAFSIIHAMKNIKCDRLVWVDADTIIKMPIPEQLIHLACPDDCLSAHFSVYHDKENKTWHSCETGFFILNKNHSEFKNFCNEYERIYTEDDTTGIRRFYDGEVYGKVVDYMLEKDVKMLNMNPGKHKTPVSRSLFAPYINHFKGSGHKANLDVDAELAKYNMHLETEYNETD